MADDSLVQAVTKRRNDAVSASATMSGPDPMSTAIQGMGVNLAAMWDALLELAAAVDRLEHRPS